MGKAGRSSVMFATGALAGGALVLAAYLVWFAPQISDGTVFSSAALPPSATEPEAGPQVLAAAAPPATVQPVLASSCPTQPLAAARSAGDGQFALATAMAMQPRPDPSAFLTVAREAAKQGRDRDAEVAYIAACHVAEQATGAHSAPVADVKSQLGQHYVALAGGDGEGERRQPLLQRASALFSESTEAYAGALGRHASKTRLAAQWLASLQEPDTLQVAARAAREARDDPEGSDARVLGAARPSAQPADEASEAAAAPARRLIQGDPDLAQLERDMQRLHAQASSVSSDRAAMQRRDAQALAQRSACRDEACLRNWYAQRRAQLLNEF